MREKLLDYFNGNENLKFEGDFFGEFFNDNLLPGDTLFTEITYKPTFVKDNKFNLHILFVYENELGNISDSYFSILYDNFPMLWEKEWALNEKNDRYLFWYKIIDNPKERFKIIDYRKDFKTYNEEESEKIKDWLIEQTLTKEANNNR